MKQQIATRVMVFHNGKVLLIREAKTYADGTNPHRYDFPGGRIEVGESVLDGAKREALEESGLIVEVHEPFFVDEWRPTIRGEPHQIIGIYFKATSASETVTLGPEHDEHVWIVPEDYKHYTLMESIKKAFEAYLKHKH